MLKNDSGIKLKQTNEALLKNYDEAIKQGVRALRTGRMLEKMINQRIKLDEYKTLNNIKDKKEHNISKGNQKRKS